MTETAAIALSTEHADQFIEQLSHEGRAVLYRALVNTTIDPDMLEELGVEGQTIAQIQAGEKPKVICPHIGCEEMYQPTDLVHISHHQRGELLINYNFDFDNGIGYLAHENYGDSDGWEWNHEALFCPRCKMPVALPAKWRLSKNN